jgi:hypothetical protein
MLHSNVPDADDFYARANVLVNTIKTGSGVQVKSLEMLMTDAPIVSTMQGVRGLPESVKQQFNICDTAQEFATAIISNLRAPDVDLTARQSARELFGVAALKSELELQKPDSFSKPVTATKHESRFS